MLISGVSNQTAIVTSDGKRLTYRELAQSAQFYKDFQLERRVVLVLADNSMSAISSIAALIEVGAVPLLLNSKVEDSALTRILEIYNVPFVCGHLERLKYQDGFQLIEPIDKDYGLFSIGLRKNEVTPHNDLGILLTTSGSTGSPKLVRVSRANLLANADAIVNYLSLTSSERPLLHLPVSYTYGLSILTSHLRVGATILCTDESIVSRRFWDFAKENDFTSLPGVPYTYSMLKKLRFSEMDLPSLRTLTQAGGRLSAELQIEFSDWAQNHGAHFFVMYGQTEATARMSFLPPEQSGNKIGSIGIPVPGGSFEIIDDHGAIVDDANQLGSLSYRGPNVALGYANNEQDLALGDVFHGSLVTGDLAYRDDEGYYYLTGRSDRHIKMYGNRVSLDDIERIVSDLGIQVACIGREDLITVFIFGESLLSETEVKKVLTQKTNLNKSGFKVVVTDEIPLNLNGKVDYKKLETLLDLS